MENFVKKAAKFYNQQSEALDDSFKKNTIERKIFRLKYIVIITSLFILFILSYSESLLLWEKFGITLIVGLSLYMIFFIILTKSEAQEMKDKKKREAQEMSDQKNYGFKFIDVSFDSEKIKSFFKGADSISNFKLLLENKELKHKMEFIYPTKSKGSINYKMLFTLLNSIIVDGIKETDSNTLWELVKSIFKIDDSPEIKKSFEDRLKVWLKLTEEELQKNQIIIDKIFIKE